MTEAVLSETDHEFLDLAIEQAEASLQEGGCPVGAVLALDDRLIATGRNQRVQRADPLGHAELVCLRQAGRQSSLAEMSLFVTLAPCLMCAGTIAQFQIPRLIIGDTVNYAGHAEFLQVHGVDIVAVDDTRCIEMMAAFIADRPALWAEDMGDCRVLNSA